MKVAFWSLLIMICVQMNFANGATITVKTQYSCEQEDGDQWYSVGLVPSLAPSGYNLLVVYNNEDNGRKTLLADTAATVSKSTSGLVYENKLKTLRLVISKVRSDYTGKFSMIKDGPGSFSNLHLDCFYKNDISYNQKIGIQPRISVGN